MNNKNNYDKNEFESLKPKLRQNTSQLPDIKKKNYGFDLAESVIYVDQCGYGVSSEDDILFTYGVETCCGLVLYDENVRVLFHLDGRITPEDVIEVTNSLGLQPNATALFAPGKTCCTQGCFEYKKLEDEYRKIGYKILEQRIPATCGFVIVSENQITIGSGLRRDLDETFSIERKKLKIKTQKLGEEVIEELEDTSFLELLKAEMLKPAEMLKQEEMLKQNENNGRDE